jgi:hypothetical protein
VERNREHLLEEILLISIAAVLSGAESWNDIAEYGEDKLEWLIALNLLKHDKSSKRGVKGKRLKAAWNHPYLLKLLGI